MKPSTRTFILAALGLFAVGMLPMQADEPICTPITKPFVRDAKVDDYVNSVGELYIKAMTVTNGDCAARKVLDDDLFVPMLTVAIYHGDIRSLMPKVREDVIKLRDDKRITLYAAKSLLQLAWKVQHSR